jgi:hypothetical protein
MNGINGVPLRDRKRKWDFQPEEIFKTLISMRSTQVERITPEIGVLLDGDSRELR